MNVLVRVARFLFWLLVLSWSVWLLRRVFSWLLRQAEIAPQQNLARMPTANAARSSRRLVRDPVCGMHVDETLSVPLRDDGELLYFCSLACRDAYLSSTKKFVANA
jgi:YHS domain-containing protein